MRPESIACLNCHIGTLQRTRATYTQWLNGHLLVVPDVAAWRCDMCGDFAYDDEMLVRVELLLGSQIERRKLNRAQQHKRGQAALLPPTPNQGEPSDG